MRIKNWITNFKSKRSGRGSSAKFTSCPAYLHSQELSCSIQLCGVIMASALLLGLILCAGLTSGDVTHFQCTNGSVCAGGRVECNCTTSTGAIDWTISYRVLGSSNQSWTTSTFMFNKGSNTNNDTEYEYNFTYDEINNSSKLNFYLNASENIFIVCKNGNVSDNESTIIRDSGYYAKAPTNLTTTFNANGVTLQWEDTGNNCTSTVYQVTVNGTSNSVLTSYNNSKTTLLIHSSELNTTETYTYTVRGWNGQQSNISKPFTLGNDAITFQCESPQNNNDLAFNVTITANSTTDDCSDSCCTNITISIRLVLNTSDPQYANLSYNISYDSITGIEESMVKSEGEWNKFIQLPRNETHYFDSRQAKNQCSELGNPTCSNPMENSGNIGNIVAIILGIILFVFIALALMACCLVKQIRDKIKETSSFQFLMSLMIGTDTPLVLVETLETLVSWHFRLFLLA
ncbi:PREDICTED: uncharacterized protein LOC109584429 isoform X2 [Amphimedon queenslandica]|uniref:Fibronectin type-III domain-containing protein n=1 Tax=Amphimedon queenslandica TaxID=400682 RepID=A0AAN0JG27_AMPQE|nr:PREDICTED: uncharacterized protein LOC109584429 isoform X2 [Amphimedon queenslandica]|eukprot:XP_019855742.1 PREDICTED: uncharacterized protein LOC109584429 isoform X2 [Amphimedon queenslandica]